jgi:CopG family transcriptional regulator, nickel-responsive regulator
MSVTSISLSPTLRRKLDEIKDEKGYSSRSEVIRDAIRTYLSEYESLEFLKGNITSTITAIYNHKSTHLDHDLLHLRYEYDDIMKGNLHMHIKGDDYAEIFIAQGDADRVSLFIQNIRTMRGIEQVKYSVAKMP